MNFLCYWLGRLIIGFIRALPLTWVARLGRAFGVLGFWLDRRHREVVLKNLTLCFGQEKTAEEIQVIARENFCRILEGYLCAAKTSAMSYEQLRDRLEFSNTELLMPPRRIVLALGHFGNFEIYPRLAEVAPTYVCASTYRAINQKGLDRLLYEVRSLSGCRFFERRREAMELRRLMNEPAVIVGLFSDQHAGGRGVRGPFLGHDCSTSTAAPVFALRYDCELYTGVCLRTGLARWKLELGERIHTHADGRARPIEDMVQEINRSLEKYVRLDPANWFWVHKRWKPPEQKLNQK
jgi:lauroyl/myristoyl acyltransferase